MDGEILYTVSREQGFRLLFLDIEMPGPDGFALAERFCLDRLVSYCSLAPLGHCEKC